MTDDPTPDDAPAGPPADKTLTWVPFAAALAVIVVIGAVIFFAGAGEDNQIGTKTDSAGALVCPRDYQVRTFTPKAGAKPVKAWVPVTPSGVDGETALAPDATPSHVVLCKYVTAAADVRRKEPVALTDRVKLEGGLRAMARDLNKSTESGDSGAASRTCDYERDSYLAGLTFATGIIWVSIPGNCSFVSNGDFVTDRNLHARIVQTYNDREWRA